MNIIQPVVTPYSDDAFLALQEAWGKHPCIVRCSDLSNFVSPDRVFQSFRANAEKYLLSPTTKIPFRVWSGNNSVTCDVAAYLPIANDNGIDEYVTRILQKTDSHSCFVMLNHLYMWDAALWSEFKLFVSKVIEFSGIPPGGVDFDVICGRYEKTGFGIHLDDAENYTFILQGKKTIYTWPPSFGNVFERRIADPKEYQFGASVLVGNPGDIIYWPKTHWHVGESLEPSMTLQVAFYGADTLKEAILQQLVEALRNSNMLNEVVAEQTAVLANEKVLPDRQTNNKSSDVPTVPLISSWPESAIRAYCSDLRHYQKQNQGTIGVNFAFEE